MKSYIIEMDEKLSRMLSGEIVTMAELSTLVAAEEIAERCRENLRQHESEATGTAELRSQSAREIRSRYGPTLHEQVDIRKTEDGYSVGLNSQVAWIGAFLEYENEAHYWGTDSGEMDEPKPWLRPASDEVRHRAAEITATEFKRRAQ